MIRFTWAACWNLDELLPGFNLGQSLWKLCSCYSSDVHPCLRKGDTHGRDGSKTPFLYFGLSLHPMPGVTERFVFSGQQNGSFSNAKQWQYLRATSCHRVWISVRLWTSENEATFHTQPHEKKQHVVLASFPEASAFKGPYTGRKPKLFL